MDWSNSYNCEKWIEKFNLTYPILDDSEGEKIYNYFGDGVVPYNVVIDRNMRLIYSSSGFNKEEIVDDIKSGLKISTKKEHSLKKINYHYRIKQAIKNLEGIKDLIKICFLLEG